MKAPLKFLALPLAVGALAFAGCGGDDSSDDNGTETETTQTQPAQNDNAQGGAENGAGQVLAISADPGGALAYEETELTAKPGKVKIDFTNEAPVPHDVVVNGPDGKEVARTDVISGQSASTEFTAKKGDYPFYCSVPGHEQAGMKGTIKVQ